MKPLLAVFSCHKPNYNRADGLMKDYYDQKGLRPVWNRVQGIRDTWLHSDDRFDYLIFYGRSGNRTPLSDEVFLDVPDDYYHCQYKLHALVNYAKKLGYKQIFKVDDDCYVYMNRIVIPKEDDADVIGHWRYPEYISGFAYWMNERAIDTISKAKPDSRIWQEDVWKCKVIQEARLTRRHNGFYVDGEYFHPENPILTAEELGNNCYSVVTACSPETMKKLHNAPVV